MTTTRTVLRMRNYECKGMKREIAKEQNYENHLKVEICSSEKPANILNVSPNYSASLRTGVNVSEEEKRGGKCSKS